jgi:phage baseplate assembly protein W
MARRKVSRSFKDIDLTFQKNPITNDLSVLINERAINRSIRNLVETIPTERFFDSDIGSDVRSLLFELSDAPLSSDLESQIENVIELFEPRVDDLEVEVNSNNNEQSYEVTINYTIVGEDVPSQPFTFILEATR